MNYLFYFVRPGSNSGNHRIFIDEKMGIANKGVLKGLTAWQDRKMFGSNGSTYIGFETVNPEDCEHIVALMRSLWNYQELPEKVELSVRPFFDHQL